MRSKVILAGLVALIAFGSFASAEKFPTKPIRMIVPWSAGGGSDVLCRTFQPALEKALGQRILIENIPAGSTVVGTMELMKAKPDGYTLMFSNEAWICRYYAGTYKDKVWQKMTPIANVTSEPLGCIEVRADSPYKTWDDLLAAIKANPGKITCANPGVGSPLDIVFDAIQKAAGVELQYVPFAGGGATKTAMLGGHVDFRVCQPTEALSMVKAGQSRVLAVCNDKRLPSMPDVPTFKEVGMKVDDGYKIIRGIWAPAKMPAALADKISKIVETATKDPDFIKAAEGLLYTVDYRNPKQVRDFVNNFDTQFGPLLQRIMSSK